MNIFDIERFYNSDEFIELNAIITKIFSKYYMIGLRAYIDFDREKIKFSFTSDIRDIENWKNN